MQITDKAMQAKPQAKDTWLTEEGVRGTGQLNGRITPKGTRSFYFRYTGSDGKRVRLPIGQYDPKGDGSARFTVQQARDKSRQLSTLYRSGIRDLAAHFLHEASARQFTQESESAAREESKRQDELKALRRVKLRTLFERWRTTDLQPVVGTDGKRSGRKDGGKYVSEQLERHVFPLLGDRLATEITKADILAALDVQKSKGKQRTTSVLFSILKQMFDFALDRELIAVNPFASIKKSRIVGREVERERTLSESEILDLAELIPAAKLHPKMECAIWLLIATGTRIGELMGATWCDTSPRNKLTKRSVEMALRSVAEANSAEFGTVDLENRRWYLPVTKNQRDHTIHLSEFAVAIFRKLELYREVDEQGYSIPWVFPARDRQRPVNVKSFGKQLSDRQRAPEKRLKGRTQALTSLALHGGRWTAQDLRRTASSMMSSLGISGDVIDECANHIINSKVRRTYIRNRRESEQAIAFDVLGDRLTQLVNKQPMPENVRLIRGNG